MKRYFSVFVFILVLLPVGAQNQIDFEKEVIKIDSLLEAGFFLKADSALILLEEGLLNTTLIEEDSVQLYLVANHAMIQYRLGDCSKTLSYSNQEVNLRDFIYGNSDPLSLSARRNLGVYYLNCDFPDSAAIILETVIQIHQEDLGTPDEIYIRTLDDLAFAYSKVGQAIKSRKIYEELVSLLDKSSGGFYFQILENYTSFLINQEDYQEAGKYFGEMEEFFREKPSYVRLLKDFYNVFILQKDFVNALPISSSLSNFCIKNESACERDSINAAEYLLNSARLSMMLASYDSAKKFYDLSENAYESDPIIYNQILVEKSELYRLTGNPYGQLAVLSRSVSDQRANSLTDSASYSNAVLQLGKLYTELGKFDDADKLYDDYITDLKASGNQPKKLAVAYQSLGNQKYLKQNFNEADKYFIQAKDLLIKEGFTQTVEYASVLNSRGALEEAIANYAAAEASYRQALEIIANEENGLRIALATNLANILLQTQTENDSILVLFDSALEWQKASTGASHPAYANILGSKALYLQKTEEYDKAAEAYAEAIDIFEYTVGKNHPQYLSALVNQGLMHQLNDNATLATSTMLEAKEIYEEYYKETNPGYIQLLNNLANLYAEENRFEEAENLFVRLSNIQVREINESFTYLSESEKKNFVKDKKKLLNNFKNYIVGRSLDDENAISPTVLEKWFDLELSTKGILLNATQEVRSKIFNGDNQQLKDLFSEWALARKQLAELQSLKSEATSGKGSVDSLLAKTDALEKRLSRESASFSSAFKKQQPSFQLLRSKLGEGEAAVEIIRTEINGEGVYTALIATSDVSTPKLLVIGKGKEFEERSFKVYKNGIAFKLADIKTFDTYWRKIDTYLAPKSIERIYYAPDGVYHKISLITLYNPVKKDYLLDEIEVVQITSTKDIINKREEKGDTNIADALLVGSPKYNLEGAAQVASNNQSRGISMISSVAELPGTAIEINAIEQLISKSNTQTEVLLEDQANEANVKMNLNRQLVHIATHGFFLEESKSEYDDPMLNSGLLFAGVSNDSQGAEDGILTAYEIMNLGLEKTDMVILSACETGLGAVASGEGIYGLQRAFFVSGVNTVVMSLWKVDDAATKDLMIAFYEEYVKKGDRRQAFLKAQKKIKKKYKSPIYWGAFVMLGT